MKKSQLHKELGLSFCQKMTNAILELERPNIVLDVSNFIFYLI